MDASMVDDNPLHTNWELILANDKHPPITNFSSDGNIEVFA
jgi:hypothetical protein